MDGKGKRRGRDRRGSICAAGSLASNPGKPSLPPCFSASLPPESETKCHNLQSNFGRKSLKTIIGHPGKVTHFFDPLAGEAPFGCAPFLRLGKQDEPALRRQQPEQGARPAREIHAAARRPVASFDAAPHADCRAPRPAFTMYLSHAAVGRDVG
jgi:hypothetical protein